MLNDEVSILVDPDAASMAGGLLKALTDSVAAKSVSANAQKLYDEKYSRRTYVSKMRQLLRILD